MAKLTHALDADPKHPWIVEPTGPRYDEESYSSWGGALRSAADMEVETDDYLNQLATVSAVADMMRP